MQGNKVGEENNQLLQEFKVGIDDALESLWESTYELVKQKGTRKIRTQTMMPRISDLEELEMKREK